MKPVSGDKITKRWQDLNNLSEEQAKDFIQHLLDSQPYLATYLMVLESEDEPEDRTNDGKNLIIGLTIIDVMTKGQRAVPMITPEQIDAAEEDNTKFLESLDEGPEMNFDQKVAETMSNYNQPELLRFVIEVLFEYNTENGQNIEEMMNDDIGLALLHFKTVIDCLDKALA